MADSKTRLRSNLEYLASASRTYNLQTFLASCMSGLPRKMQKAFMPKTIKLPDGNKVFINDLSTIRVNIPDQYMRKEYAAVPSFIPRLGWNVVDVGAYVGLYSLHAAGIVGRKGRVTAFEPNPNAYYWLRRNISLNNASNVKACRVALGDAENTSNLYVVMGKNVGASSLIEEHMKSSGFEAENYTRTKVRVTTLDNVYYKSKIFEDASIDLVKIDVEGFEPNVLRGASKLLGERLIERLIIEVHVDVVSSGAVEMSLNKYDYKLDKKVKLNHVKEIHYYSG